ncbi:MAG: zinc ribbon domain-containing protein [Planctomycetes bacterium]|nr:zinc ribbon domain-containing protein [Planctomycetota bacterium]MCB9870393.1 zinc ribbon domain-containing protein [Planctomycetota bacterium]MCB9889384.1 zinc ribbon domain-containing protein [Planctomycetota bacterium]
MKCPHCGAPNAPWAPVCSFCGSARALPTATAPDAALEQTFAQLRALPDTSRLLQDRHGLPSVPPRSPFRRLLPLLMTAAMAAIVVANTWSDPAAHGTGLVAATAFIAIGLMVTYRITRRDHLLQTAPVEAVLARIQETPLDDDLRSIFALTVDGGRNRHVLAVPDLAGTPSSGSIGVAWLRGNRLLRFAALTPDAAPSVHGS